MEIQWKDVVGYEGLYMVSNKGDVKRKAHFKQDTNGRILYYDEMYLSIRKDSYGYASVNLTKDGKPKSQDVHRLVAEAFIPNPQNLPCVNHKDEDKSNSVVTNLEWCDYSYNNTYGTVLSRRSKKSNIVIDENLAKIAQSYKKEHCNVTTSGKFVVQLDASGNEIERYTSVSQAGKANGFDRHKFSRTPAINGIKVIKGKLFLVQTKENEYIPKGRKGPRPGLVGKGAKKVYQYKKDGTFIREHNSVKEAAEYLGDRTWGADISSCCNGKLKSSHGFIWSYGKEGVEEYKLKTARKINQFSITGELVGSYDSIINAIKSLGKGTPSCIGNCLSGRTHSAYGYIWRYANESTKDSEPKQLSLF